MARLRRSQRAAREPPKKQNVSDAVVSVGHLFSRRRKAKKKEARKGKGKRHRPAGAIGGAVQGRAPGTKTDCSQVRPLQPRCPGPREQETAPSSGSGRRRCRSGDRQENNRPRSSLSGKLVVRQVGNPADVHRQWEGSDQASQPHRGPETPASTCVTP